VNALKSEVANLNQSMTEMRKLLEQQNNRNTAASNAELLAIKAEISKLSNSVNSISLGAAKLDAPSMQIIQSVAQLMNQYPEVYAELEGFTDSSGNADANLILSGKRATAVQNFLVQYGIAANRLITIPRGEDPASNASYGRRVAIKLNVR